MEINRTNIRVILANNNIVPSKEYGQNFLVEPTVAKRIVDLLELNDSDDIIEIGGGVGSLTHFLLENNHNSKVLDIDANISHFLDKYYPGHVICSDAFKYDFSSYNKIISNLPYSVTTDLLVYLLVNAKACSRFVFMCQKETLSHFTNIKGSEYGPASVLIHVLGNIKKQFDVSPNNFVPAPKCVSSVFVINVNNRLDIDYLSFYRFVQALFSNRRKTILNNLTGLVGKERANEMLTKLNIPVSTRPEQIKPEIFFDLYRIK